MQPQTNARYLLRFDDICPTMNWTVWAEIEAALIKHRIRPILAVVPDNQDPVLQVEAPMQDFWQRVREWQARGWTIALHGFQHKYIGRRSGFITRKKLTEFAGLAPREQEEKLRRGLEILEEQKVRPSVWIAPNNSFDETTVALLHRLGIRTLCDGNFRFPFTCKKHMVWVPQQLFGFRPAPPGVWTVCYHHNNWTAADCAKFQRDLSCYRASISSLNEVLEAWPGRPSRWLEWLSQRPRLSQFLIRCELKLWELWSGHSNGAQIFRKNLGTAGS
jgi:predicted deacetylase